MQRKGPWLIGAFFLILAGIQFIPVARSNPPSREAIQAPEKVMNVLEKSCYDCHSHETSWPFYSRIAPISWLVAHDVNEGREHLNFSMWDLYDREKKFKLMDEIMEEVEEGEMPLFIYLLAHPDAKLSEADQASLRQWAKTVAGR